MRLDRLSQGALFTLTLLGAASAAWTQEDTTPPALFSAHAADYDGTLGLFRFYIDEKLDRNSVPAREAFQVQIEGVDWKLSGVVIAMFRCVFGWQLRPFSGTDAEPDPVWRPDAKAVQSGVHAAFGEPAPGSCRATTMAAFDAHVATCLFTSRRHRRRHPPPPPEPEPSGSDCTLVAPHWSGPTGGFTVRPAPGRNSVSLTCGPQENHRVHGRGRPGHPAGERAPAAAPDCN